MFSLVLGCVESGEAQPGAGGSGDDSRHAERFAVFSPAIGVMLRDLGYEDQIVGRHSYDTALSDSIPVVGTHMEIDYEVLLNQQPTHLVFERNTIELPARLIEMSETYGWFIWRYKLESLDDIAHTVDDLYLKLEGFPEGGQSELPGGIPDPDRRLDARLPSERLAGAWSPLGASGASAGRVLLLAGVDPPGALGPGSFHAQMIERMGVESALKEGGMWQELDLEDLITLAPDSVILLSPRTPEPTDMIGEPEPMAWDEVVARLGGIGELPIPAVERRRIAVIEHPQALLPSTTLAPVADAIRETLVRWHEREGSP